MRQAGALVDHALALAAVTEASVAVLLGGRRGAARRVRLAGAEPDAGHGVADAWRCTRAVARAAQVVPWRVRCLPAALALHRVLAWRGSASRVRLGVRADGGAVLAHAWVECQGVVLDPLSPDEPYEPLPMGQHWAAPPGGPTGEAAGEGVGGPL